MVCVAAGAVAAEPPRPKLIVQITMDQLRGDLLRRYTPALQKGFRRMEERGFWVRRGDAGFGLTLSFPGHAALATGMFPSHHGLTANEWWVQRDGKWNEIDVSDDARYQIVGSPASRVGASPHNMTATTLGEWVRQADPGAKSIAIGTGGRIPIAYAGSKATAALWFDSALNQFTTSTFYASARPAWVEAFNRDELPKFELRSWTSTVPAEFVKLASGEATYLHGARTPSFPHAYEKESSQPGGGTIPYPNWFAGTPLKDEALFAMAQKAVEEERLGQRGAIDYLAIDVDSTDGVGHAYGARSLEQLDTLVRLDKALGDFLDYLDRTVGKGNYAVALSADHGVADPPQHYPGGRTVTMADLEGLLDKVEATAAANQDKGEKQVIAAIVAVLKSSDFVADAYTREQLTSESHDRYARLYARVTRPEFTTDFPLWTDKPREHHPARYGILVRFKPGMVIDAAVGVHGSPYPYDRDIPVIFYGAGIRSGHREEGARSVDVAPTLAAAAGIEAPKSLDGRVLRFALLESGRERKPVRGRQTRDAHQR